MTKMSVRATYENIMKPQNKKQYYLKSNERIEVDDAFLYYYIGNELIFKTNKWFDNYELFE